MRGRRAVSPGSNARSAGDAARCRTGSRSGPLRGPGSAGRTGSSSRRRRCDRRDAAATSGLAGGSDAYTIDDLARDGRTSWEGVRNYQARNFMRDRMHAGDGVLFYASNAEPSGVTGLATIAREGYPDPFAFKKGHRYFDPDSRKDAPTWYAVDLAFAERFSAIVPLETLKATPGLEAMMVTRKGSRLSVQPVSAAEYAIVVRLGRGQRLPKSR
jgi:predicted RNA-binding protein with PUA-like domain